MKAFLIYSVIFLNLSLFAWADTTYLGLKQAQNVKTGWGTPGDGKTVNGNDLSIGSTSFERGFSLHAPGEATFALDGTAKWISFSTGIAGDMADRYEPSVILSVEVDGKEAYISPILRAGQDPTYATVPVDGAKRVRFVISDAGDGNGADHLVIANFRTCTDMEKPKSEPVKLSVPFPEGPLAIDLTTSVAAAFPSPYGPGTTKNPSGDEITADTRSFFLNGKPWIPIVGEFHYARYPRAEWRDELLKMKAGGINTVSTYVFWIHHEEEQGKFDWSGQRSLRDFLLLAQEVGLKAFVRMGPWSHGEVRNGGFPDWVQQSGTNLRSNDPRFFALVLPFFRQQAKQMEGLLWKDGGPVVGIQLDNENDRADYLLALKEVARKVGVDVPFYAITGWQGGLPKTDLIPLFGGYSDGFWGGSHEDYRKEFLFNEVRAMNDLGAQGVSKNPANSQLIAQFPYACVEIGGGMMSAYGRRIKIEPTNVAALALAKLGSGNNMPGYYMYQGGINPDGKLSLLHEDYPNQLPVKNYDFQAPLGAEGQVREQYHLLRQQHLFLEDFGADLARMPAFFPKKSPANLRDFKALRWNVRSDGKTGFLFFNNQQPYEPLPDHENVQFEIKTASGTMLVPRSPMTIPSGGFGIFPLNLDCDGVTLEYATAQPLSRISTTTGTTYFFTALDGIAPEMVVRSDKNTLKILGGEGEKELESVRISNFRPGTGAVVSVTKADKKVISFVVLAPQQGRRLWKLPLGGQERALISDAALLPDGNGLRLQSNELSAFEVSVFPRIQSIVMGSLSHSSQNDGVFSRFTYLSRPLPLSATQNQQSSVFAVLETPAGSKATTLSGTNEASWQEAAVYKLNISADAANRSVLLNIGYIGDAARLYVGAQLFDDNYYNGDDFSVALWRIPASDWHNVRLKVLPFSERLLGRLSDFGQAKVNAAKASATLDKITVSSTEQLETRLDSIP